MIIKNFEEINEIKVFNNEINENHSDYNAKGLDKLFEQEEKHFWFIVRKEFIFENIVKFIGLNEKIIEIGAGTGNVSRFLQKKGYNNISVGEMHLNGLKYAQTYGIENCYQFDLLDAPFEKEFDVVCMFDVLEHIEADEEALHNVSKILNKKGKIILTVPAHMWLWNRDDAVAGHKKRYTKKQLIEILERNGFEILFARYFFMFITPLLVLRRIFNKDNKKIVKNEEYGNEITINPIINWILLKLSKFENKINKYLPNLFGGSLFIIARKNDTI